MDFLVNLDVDDLGRGIAFYEKAFGLEVGRRFGDDGVEMNLKRAIEQRNARVICLPGCLVVRGVDFARAPLGCREGTPRSHSQGRP